MSYKVVFVMDKPKSCLHCKMRNCLHINEKFYQNCRFDTNGYALESFFREEDLSEDFVSEKCPLVSLEERDREIRNKVIDTFMIAIETHMKVVGNTYLEDIREIAERLKEVGE